MFPNISYNEHYAAITFVSFYTGDKYIIFVLILLRSSFCKAPLKAQHPQEITANTFILNRSKNDFWDQARSNKTLKRGCYLFVFALVGSDLLGL